MMIIKMRIFVLPKGRDKQHDIFCLSQFTMSDYNMKVFSCLGQQTSNMSSVVITTVSEFIGRREGGSRSVNHIYSIISAVCDTNSLLLVKKKEKKIVDSSLYVTKRETRAVCPWHRTRGQNVIKKKISAASYWFVLGHMSVRV